MQELIAHPLAAIFVESTATLDGQALTYYSLFETPLDLLTILHKLRTGRYRTSQEWETEVGLLFESCIALHGPDSMTTKVALFLRQRFRKLAKQLRLLKYDTWIESADALSQKLTRLLGSRFFKRHFHTGSVLAERPEPLAKRLSALTRRCDISAVVRLLGTCGVEFSHQKQKLTLNLDALPAHVVDALYLLLAELEQERKRPTGKGR
jgi:hypothetical protein